VRRSTILLFLVLALAGCGATDEERIRDTIDRYGEAVADGNPKKVCDEIIGKDGPCEAEFTQTILGLSEVERTAVRDIEVTDIRIVGRVAEVKLDTGVDAVPNEVRLRKEGRKWSLDPDSLKPTG
jgi:hypothetical protein